MEKFIDLHVHTTASDGMLTPTQVLEKACGIGLSAVGIADHDTVDGVEEGLVAGQKLGIEVVPGVEFTCYEGDDEYHMLGYFIDFKDERLLKIASEGKRERVKRAKTIIDRLNQLGFKTSYGDVSRLARGVIGRPHLAMSVIDNSQNEERLMAEFGEIPSIGKFIETYIISGKPAYVPKRGFTLMGVIEFIHRISGIAILAHPGFYPDLKRKGFLQNLVDLGLDGIEAIAPVGDFAKIQRHIKVYFKWAKEHGLLVSGGSDYHGSERIGANLGFVGTEIKVPYELLEKMRKYHQERFGRIESYCV
jgi:predicted metal-dependent phosphoesterase TrpH